jgi:hypothetical protein
MRILALLLTTTAALALSASAQAGCWATVGLSSLPNGVRAGEPWSVAITVKQHGRTLLPDAKPMVKLTSPSGRKTVFRAKKTDDVGVYRARVVFASPGEWRFSVFDGFFPSCAHEHTYAKVTIRR